MSTSALTITIPLANAPLRPDNASERGQSEDGSTIEHSNDQADKRDDREVLGGMI
jgi:hypothetical protein